MKMTLFASLGRLAKPASLKVFASPSNRVRYLAQLTYYTHYDDDIVPDSGSAHRVSLVVVKCFPPTDRVTV